MSRYNFTILIIIITSTIIGLGFFFTAIFPYDVWYASKNPQPERFIVNETEDVIDIVFRKVFNGDLGWTVYPGGAGWQPSDSNSFTMIPQKPMLVLISEEVSIGVPALDFEKMLDDKIFVDKCELNNGIWNYTYHDCTTDKNNCEDIGGISIRRDVTPCIVAGVIDDDPLAVKVCYVDMLLRNTCVFEYNGE